MALDLQKEVDSARGNRLEIKITIREYECPLQLKLTRDT